MMSYSWTQNYYYWRHLLFQKSLTHLFCLSYMSRVVPSDRKLARITPIYKGKDPLNSETNYRPISVLSHVVKILEKQVHKQLIEYLETYAFITPYQSSYLKKHSTVTHLHRVVDDLCESIDDGYLSGVCFLDMEKCFDSINHKILPQKLSITVLTQCLSYGSKTIYMIVHNVYESTISHQKNPCYVGVLYVNDLPQYVQNQNCNIFADDTIIFSVGSYAEDISSKLQGTLDTIMPWYMSNRLRINTNKSAVMLIGKPSQIQVDVDIKINDMRIEQVQSMKYLYTYKDNRLSCDV